VRGFYRYINVLDPYALMLPADLSTGATGSEEYLLTEKRLISRGRENVCIEGCLKGDGKILNVRGIRRGQ